MASMFLILKTQDLTSAVFVCPSSNAQPSPLPGVGTNPAGPGSYQCWPDTPLYNVVSYSIECPFPSSTALCRRLEVERGHRPGLCHCRGHQSRHPRLRFSRARLRVLAVTPAPREFDDGRQLAQPPAGRAERDVRGLPRGVVPKLLCRLDAGNWNEHLAGQHLHV